MYVWHISVDGYTKQQQQQQQRKANRKQKWKEKQLYGYFKRQTSDISLEKTWTWQRKETLREKLNLFW